MIAPFTRSLLFVSSYFPLFLILTLLNWTRDGYWSLVPTLVGLGGLVGLPLTIYWVRTTATKPFPVAKVQRKDTEALAYLVTYLFPFLDIDLGQPAKVASFIVLFVTIGVIYISANMLHTNPVLNLFGWHVYEIETPEGTSITVIARRSRLVKGETIQCVELTEGVGWVRRAKSPG